MDAAALDAVAQADLIRSGAASPVELVDAAIARIESVNPALNAVIRERFDAARAEARAAADAPDAPFRGVPLLLKDLSAYVADEPLHEGMRFLRDAQYRAPYTDAVAQRFLDAGFVVLGRTNTPELGILPTTEPATYGPTHNPWRAGTTPGGSSGGSAAAVASRMVAVAHANDGGGSIRIPASCCGLVGLKPTRGRVPHGAGLNEISNFLIAEHVVTRTVRDTAAVLDVTGAPRRVGATRAPSTSTAYRDDVGDDPGVLRIGVLDRDPTGTATVHPECVAAVEITARLLGDLGHHLEPSFPSPWADETAMIRFGQVWAVECAYFVDDWAEKVGRPVAEDEVEPLTWALATMGRGVTGPELIRTIVNAMAEAEDAAAWWRPDPRSDEVGFDLLLTPTLAEPPVPHGTFPSTPEEPLVGFIRAGEFVPFTTQSNISGQPAISLPLHRTADGLPVGIQLVAAFGREDLLIRVAAQLEAAAPWGGHLPPVHA